MNWHDKNSDHIHDQYKIKGFSGEYRWLSNFHPCEVWFEGMKYPSSECAYQAAKSIDPEVRKQFQNITAGYAKKLGKKIQIRDDWEKVKVVVMSEILRDKFTRNRDLYDKLKANASKYLEETNWWGDTFWGVCNGKGENMLGNILMYMIQRDTEWINFYEDK